MSEAPSGDLMKQFSAAEWTIGGGAAWLLVVCFLVGNRIQYEYFATIVTIDALLSIGILLAIYAKHSGGESAWNGLYPGSLNAAGTALVTMTVLDMINGLANDFSQSGEFYELTLYIAAAVVAFGLFLLRQEQQAPAA
ncbi:MAG: hypothetical protein GY720_14915 [bacterium]|nr:hypothetical protein [bacterium]